MGSWQGIAAEASGDHWPLSRGFWLHMEVPLKEFIMEQLAERDKRYQERFEAQEMALRVALESLGRRLDSVNEFRQTLSDQATSFIPRPEYATGHQALEDKVQALTDRVNLSDGQAKGSQLTKGALYAGLAAAATILGIIVLLANKVIH